jgi:predicted membrane protein
VNLLNFLFLFFVLINSCVLPLLYPKLWLLFITILILLSLVLYRKLVRKEKINNTIFLITFFIAIFNLLITMLGYTTNFLLISIKNKENQKKNSLQIQNNTIIKGKVGY